MSPCPGGHHSRLGSAGQLTGVRSSDRSLGSRFCRKSSGRPSVARPGCAASAASVSSEVRKLSMNTTGRATSYSLRSAITCSAMMSRKLLPGRTWSSDLALSSPIDVPSPPFSLTTAVAAIAALAAAGSVSRSASRGSSAIGSRSVSASMPVSPEASTP